MLDTELIKRYLEREQTSQSQLAQKIGVTKTMMNYIVRGLKQPSLLVLERMADVTGYSTDELLGRCDSDAASHSD